MTELKDKVKFALDESRILILGCQVLLGFQFRSFFEQRFDELPHWAQYLKLGALFLLLIALLLLIFPAAHHRIVEQGQATEEQHRITSAVMDYALLPFAVVLGVELYIAAREIDGPAYAGIAAGGILLITFLFWYGLEWAVRARRKKGGSMTQKEESGRTPLTDKIEHVLTECRVALPGVQALLGFQFATILTESFARLPTSSQQVHMASLMCIAVSMVLLMAPAAFHRIVEEGEVTERFHRCASRLLLAALVPLALGVSGALFVVTRKLTDSLPFSIAAAITALVTFLTAWFGITTYIRTLRRQRSLDEAAAAI